TCRVLLASSLLDRASFLISAGYKLGLDRKLLGRETHRITCCGFIDAFDLVKNPARLNYRHPVFRRALAFAHTRFRRLLRDRLVGKHANPDLAAALDVTSHRNTSSLDLTIRDPRGLQTLESILTEADLAATSRDASHASTHLLTVLNFLRHQHDECVPCQLSVVV